MGKVIMLNGVRCSFLTLGEPERYQNKPTNKPRWSATALVPYASPYKKQIDDILVELCKTLWEKKWEVNHAALINDAKACCWRDGKFKDYEGYANNFALSAHRYEDKGRPLVYDKDKTPIYKTDNSLYEGKAGVLYSGCFVNMQVELWAFENRSTHEKNLGATLLGIQKFKDADAFSGGTALNPDAFGDLAETAGAEDLT